MLVLIISKQRKNIKSSNSSSLNQTTDKKRSLSINNNKTALSGIDLSNHAGVDYLPESSSSSADDINNNHQYDDFNNLTDNT
jgi:hypothetical protein